VFSCGGKWRVEKIFHVFANGKLFIRTLFCQIANFGGGFGLIPACFLI
jgi:hypothetical protein